MWSQHDECRAELNRVRQAVRGYIDTLGLIAGTPDLAATVVPLARSHPSRRVAIKAHKFEEGYRPRRAMVRWLSLLLMFGTAGNKFRGWFRPPARPGHAGAPAEPTKSYAPGSDGEFWFDYVADLGDAFDPTAAVAWLLAQKIELPVDAHQELPQPPTAGLPPGAFLVMGGDEVYPYASTRRYERQTIAPYAAAWKSHPAVPDVYAVAGNHDWMGGIGAFEQCFLAAGNAETPWKRTQPTRWFALELPHGWWLWGYEPDAPEGERVEQDRFFAAAGARAQAASASGNAQKVILATPVPLWQLRQKDAKRHDLVRERVDAWSADHGLKFPLFLSGDSHYFAHYERAAVAEASGPLSPLVVEHHVTAGGGGAFLHPTNSLSQRVPAESGPAEFDLTARWPTAADSRGLAPRLGLLADRQFVLVGLVVAALHYGYTALVRSRGWAVGDPQWTSSWFDRLGWVAAPAASWPILAVLIAGAVALMLPNTREALVTRAARFAGLAHGLALAALWLAATTVAQWFVDEQGTVAAPVWPRVLVSLVVGVLTLGVLLTVTSWTSQRMKVNDNLAFAAAHSSRFKHLVRFRIDATGALTVFVVGLDPIGKGWFEAFRDGRRVPPSDPAGMPHLHYVWGTTIKEAST